MEASQSQALAVVAPASQQITVFSSESAFVSAQRMAKALVSSDLVPEVYRGEGKIGNALVALEMAQRMGASALAVMQNLHVIHGRPSWSSSFIIAAVSTCGRFSPLRFRMTGEGDDRQCVATATDLASGEVLEGPPSSIAMAKAEGWYGKNGSKWKTMPELMLRYRAAAFFGRLYAPDILNGMQAREEIEDVIDIAPERSEPRNVTPEPPPASTAEALDKTPPATRRTRTPKPEPSQPAGSEPAAQQPASAEKPAQSATPAAFADPAAQHKAEPDEF